MMATGFAQQRSQGRGRQDCSLFQIKSATYCASYRARVSQPGYQGEMLEAASEQTSILLQATMLVPAM